MFAFGARALFILVIFNLNTGKANKFVKRELDSAYPESQLNNETHNVFVNLRQKRETRTILAKNQYESVPQNTNATMGNLHKAVGTAIAPNISSIVAYNTVDRPLLDVNGTGQTKDVGVQLSMRRETFVSDSIQPKLAAGISATPAQTKVENDSDSSFQSTDMSEEKIIDNVDVPANETFSAIGKYNYTINTTNDYHTYYNSSMYVDKMEADRIWNLVKNISFNSMLSQSHRRAMTVEMSFQFPFYGHPIQNVTVATGGFLYTGDYVHSWLAATQYVAPLMANFDTSLSNESFVRIQDNGTALTVIWEKVSLQDKQNVGEFTFSATLHSNGDIVFIYYNVPIDINAIQDDKHPVKVGLSDAYIIDKTVYNTRRKTIYEYHRVNLSNNEISNGTIIYLKALPTCLDYKNCVACSNHKTSFDCAWCPTISRCSTGTDRRKQDWQQKGCDRIQIMNASVCPSIGQKGNGAKQENNSDHMNYATSTITNVESVNNRSGSDRFIERNRGAVIPPYDEEHVASATKEDLEVHPQSKSMGIAIGFLVPISLVLTVLLWVFYAYRNPHTKSGQLLIQYRPSQWSWRRGEARYTAATIHM